MDAIMFRRRALIPLILTLAPAAAIPAGTAPDGFEFIVPGTTAGDQSRPIVASRGPDGFVVVWSSFGQLVANEETFARLFNEFMFPLGDEFQVNGATAGDQSEARIGSNDFGEFVIVFTGWFQGDGDGQGVLARRYDSSGTPVGAEFVVNTSTAGAQYRPDVSMNATGGFVAVWADGTGQDGDDFGIFGQRFDSSGATVGGEFQVNSYTTGAQSFPRISMEDTGEFVVVWDDFSGRDGSGASVAARRFDSSGSALGADFLVNTSTAGTQRGPDIALFPSGAFVVVWGDGQALDGSGYSVRGQLFDSSGMKTGGEFQVNTTTLNDQRFPSVGSDPAGRFVVTWTSSVIPGSDEDVQGQRFFSDGSPLGLEFQLNAYTPGRQRATSVATAAGGDFVVSWMDGSADGDGEGAIARRFFGNAQEILDPRPGDMVDCTDPRTFQPTFTWDPGDYDRFKVYMSPFSTFLKGSVVKSGRKWLGGTSWTVQKKKWKRACDKALAVNPGNPLMHIRLLGKDKDLSRKDPARKIKSFTVVVEAVD